MTPSRFCGTIPGYEACALCPLRVLIVHLGACGGGRTSGGRSTCRSSRSGHQCRSGVRTVPARAPSRRAGRYRRARLPPIRSASELDPDGGGDSRVSSRALYLRRDRIDGRDQRRAERSLKIDHRQSRIPPRARDASAAAKGGRSAAPAGRSGREPHERDSTISNWLSPTGRRSGSEREGDARAPVRPLRTQFEQGHSAARRPREANNRAGTKARDCSPRRMQAPVGPPRPSSCWINRPPTIRSLLPTLADFYERQRRWADAANAYARALQRGPAQHRSENPLRAGAAQRRRSRRTRRKHATRSTRLVVDAQRCASRSYMLSQANRASRRL